MPNIFFTSDLHFGHQNVIRFENRPLSSVEEMNNTLIENWNAKVNKKDLVYVLGDVSWYKDQETSDILQNLKGRKILIKGNHDRVNGQVRNHFENITSYDEIVLNVNKHIVLCHFPVLFFNRHRYGSYMLYGHVHNSSDWIKVESYREELEAEGISFNAYNVGTMVQNYEPVTIEEIIKNYERQKEMVRTIKQEKMKVKLEQEK